MHFFEDRGDLGPPPDPFRVRRRRRQPPVPLRWIGLVAGLLVLLFVLSVVKSIYVDLLWFDSVGYGSVFRRVILMRVVLFFLGAVIAGGVLGVNIWLARRLAPRAPEESFIEDIDPEAIRRIVSVALIAATLFLAVVFGGGASGAWETILAWQRSIPFGVEDPAFGRDASFYMFSLPAYHFLQSWAFALLIVSILGAGAVYALTFSLQGFALNVTREVRVHLSVLAALLLLTIALGIYLSIFDLASSGGGIVDGATYTDIHAREPVRYVLMAVTVFAALVIVASAFLSTSYRAAIFALGVWAFLGVVGGLIYPSFVQSVQVSPNELQKEEPFIARNIRLTRIAWGLEGIQETNFPAKPALTAADVAANSGTLANVRLWDPGPLRDTFNQIQSIRPFYTFPDVDVDRYDINGQPRQVMLSIRELDATRIAANWTRQRLQLTHGFGAVAAPVNEVRDEGLPTLITRDIPPVSDGLPLSTEGARVYFGERTDDYVIVRTNVAEFDYPVGEGNAETRYQPDRGIRLSSFIRRAALAWDLGDTNLLISGQLSADSRVLMHRSITDRVQKIAPFLRLDPDPYAVIDQGRLLWIQDAYTTSGNFPYSQHQGDINYIRNSVKVVMDANTGDLTFYLIQPDDPVAATWARIFPKLFTPADKMPPAIRQHLRYPEQMFKLQSQQYLRYHITDPRVFFVGEDLWNIPTQNSGQQQREQTMDPYYLTMKLPGEADEEFVIVEPFTPRNKQNTIAWLAGRSDGDFYGTLRAYRFPTDTLVYGPAQIEARIDQNPGISQQLTLWNQSGSRVIRGNLFMIPINESFLFVEPVYLQAESSQLPELKRVVIANGNNVAMEPTFEAALQVVLGQRASSLPGGGDSTAAGSPASPAPTGSATPAPTGSPRPSVTGTAIGTPAAGGTPTTIDQARQAADNAQRELDRLRTLLDQLQAQQGR